MRSLTIILLLTLFLTCLFACDQDDDDDSTNGAVTDDDNDDTALDDDDDDNDNDNDNDDDDVQPQLPPTEPVNWGRYVCAGDMTDATKVTMVTYNLHGGQEATAGEIAWGLEDHRPFDLVALEECSAMYAEMIADELDMEYFHHEGRALLSDTPLIDPTGQVFEGGYGFIHAGTVINNVGFSVYVVHSGWNDNGDAHCREFIDEVVSQDSAERLILAGDWNDEPGSTQFAILFELLADAFSSLGVYPTARVSWPAQMFYGSEGAQLIDNVLFNKDSGACAVDGDVINFVPPLSDHKPAIATIAYPAMVAPQPPHLLDVLFGYGSDGLALLFDKPIVSAEISLALGETELPVQQMLPLENGFIVYVQATAPLPDNAELTATVTAAADIDGNELAEPVSLTFAHRRDLLLNGGAEEGENGWELTSMQSTGNFWQSSPLFGNWMFTGLFFLDSRGYAVQNVDLTPWTAAVDAGRASLVFGGACRTGYLTDHGSNLARAYDEAEATVHIYDADGNLLRHLTSGRYDTMYWQPWRLVAAIPPNARRAKVRLRAVGGISGLLFNSASFDTLHLSVAVDEQSHGYLGGNLLLNDQFYDGLDEWETIGTVLVGADRWAGPVSNADISSYSDDFWTAGLMLGGPTGASQNLELSALSVWIDAGRLKLVWGAALRSLIGLSDTTLTLTLRDAWGQETARDTIGPLGAAEWFLYEKTLRVPAGTRFAEYRWDAEPHMAPDGSLIDEPFIFPVRR